ncbi:MAG: hypothetical protein IKO05_05355 [Selenomonadaceae bacterium]|nr:hypothetical protein [Selenomonadaceae bacterium]
MGKKNLHLYETISSAANEEELKHLFVNFFGLPFSTKNRVDLYTEQILFEFKFNENFHHLPTRAKVIAQALYYVRRLKLGDDDRAPSENICVVSKNFAAFFPTETFADFCAEENYDWDLKPSAPCKKLVADLTNFNAVIHAHVYELADFHEQLAFETLINNTVKKQRYRSTVKRQITVQNFFQVFRHWKKFFGDAVANGHKPSEYFLLDIEQGKTSLVDDNSVIFRMSDGEIREKLLNPDEYKYFWNHYAKISDAREIISIRQKMDRITEISLRRFTGEFYTPISFAAKAFDYLTRAVGRWWTQENFRLWDMAAGTGNLEFAVPPEALKFCYISTLIKDEADYCQNTFPAATAFQFDYLNDPADKLPQKLRDDLADPNIRWIIFINPPYATANNKKITNPDVNKSGVADTAIRKLMTEENLGEVSRELFSQFIYRISKDFSQRQVWLGIFSKLKYLNSTNDQRLRDKFFKFKFERGFVLNSKSFEGCKAQFPVGFLVWNLGEQLALESQKISLDVYDSVAEKVGKKIIRPARREEFLSKWIERPPCRKKFPPLSGALNVAARNKDRRDRIAENFLASLTVKGNEFSNQTYTAFLSAPYVSAGALSVTAENFEQAMVVHMVRRLPKATWLNDRDQFMQPTKILPREFVTDAVVWSLFAPSNQTASLRDVEYEGEVYQIKNNFFPFALSELQAWECSEPQIRWQIARATEERFAAAWLKKNRADLSAEAAAVLNAARKIYKRFYAELLTLDRRKWKIEDWDAGWYQVRMALGAKIDLSALSEKLLPQIYELGFLRDELIEFT